MFWEWFKGYLKFSRKYTLVLYDIKYFALWKIWFLKMGRLYVILAHFGYTSHSLSLMFWLLNDGVCAAVPDHPCFFFVWGYWITFRPLLILSTQIPICIPDRRQSKTLILSTNLDKIIRNRGFDCCLSPDWRQMSIKNTVFNDFWSMFIDC